jgi:putative MATE family efflux protein
MADPPQPEPSADRSIARVSRLQEFLDRARRAVWVMGLPMMLGFMVHALYSVVDTAFIGALGRDALAAATFVIALYLVAIALINGIGAGITAAVAQAIGRQDRAAADSAASTGLGISVSVGLVLLVVGQTTGEPVMVLLGARGETVHLAWQYFQPICWGMPFFFASGAMRSILTGEGDSRTPMLVVGAATLINLGLDPLFIFVAGFGIAGAAYATLAAQLSSAAILSYLVFGRRKTFCRISLRATIAPTMRTVFLIARVGAPAALGQMVMALGMGLVNRVVAEFGQHAVAGYGAGSKIDLLVALPILGLSGGAMSVVGMFAGAKRADLVRSTTLYAYRVVVLATITFGTTAWLLSSMLIGLFTDDAGAFSVGQQYLSYMVFAYPLMAFGITSGRILQGLGYGMPTLVITVVRVLLVGTAGSYIAVYLFSAPIHVVWICFIVGGAAANALSLYWIIQAAWRHDPTLKAQAG